MIKTEQLIIELNTLRRNDDSSTGRSICGQRFDQGSARCRRAFDETFGWHRCRLSRLSRRQARHTGNKQVFYFVISLLFGFHFYNPTIFLDRGSFDQNSVDQNCVFSVDQKFHNQLIEFF
jgi:hypothetical protein